MNHRINHQSVFLLASKAWRENSLWVEVFSCDYGRVALLARSARTRGSELRGVLVPFVPILASWYGKEELKTLHRAEWVGGWGQPSGQALFSALYVNELVLKLTAREDAHSAIYHAMYAVMQAIGSGGAYLGALRQFEWRLLNALGIAPDFERDDDGQLVDVSGYYWVRADETVRRVDDLFRQPDVGVVVSGAVLRQIVLGQLDDANLANDAAKVMRLLLDFRLPDVQARRVLQQLKQFKNKLL